VADASEFVDTRRRELLRFLKRLSKHRILGQSEEFCEFIKNQKFYHAGAASSGITKSLKYIWVSGKEKLGFNNNQNDQE
jgi:hypothetical protein